MLRTNKHSVRSILTTNGVLTIDRYCLRPKSPEDLLKLSELLGVTCIYPLDSYLRIDKLPFKMTLELMLSICEIAIESKSYEHAEAQVIRVHHIPISDDTIRSVVDDVGKIVYSYDCQMAMNAKRLYETGGIVHKNDMDGTLYLSTDGAYINTREVVNGSGWHECKLGLVFDSNQACNKSTSK